MLLIFPRRKLLLTGVVLLFIIVGFAFARAKHPRMDDWQAAGQVVCRFKTAEKAVALTFDDGPNPEATPAILKTLAEHQAQATFFVVGTQLEAYPELAGQIAAAGHELGNHSSRHADFNQLDHDAMRSDIKSVNDKLEALTGQPCRWLRPPGGYLSVDLVDNIAPELGLTIGYWSYEQDSKDWQGGRSGETIADYVIRHIAPGQIILLHDGGGNGKETARAVALILDTLTQAGYRFLTLSEMAALAEND